MTVKEIKEEILKNKKLKGEGKVTSISPPFPRLAEKFPGYTKGKLWIFTASSGVGKTKLTKFFTITSVVNFCRANNLKYKIFYFALEESRREFKLSFLSTMLYEKYNVSLSPAELMSFGNFTISDDQMKMIESCEEELEKLFEFIEIHDDISNSYGIYKEVRAYFEANGTYTKVKKQHSEDLVITGYIPNNPEEYVFCITDHVSLLSPDKGKTLHETMSYFSKEYCLKGLVKRFNAIVINVQQQAAEKEKIEVYQGQTVEQKLEPSLDGLGENKTLQREADLVLGLFAPDRYQLEKHRGYDITKLKDNYRSIKFLKDRHYGLANFYVPLYFNGASNYFEELPKPDQIDYSKYKKL